MGVTAEEIKNFRTKTTKLKGIAPIDSKATLPGEPFKHGGNGSTAFHNELGKIIDDSNSLSELNTRIKTLMNRWKIDPSLLPPLN